jgi:hypothetical protein
MELTQERLKELLSYDPLTGVFLWKVAKKHGGCVGDVAGSKNSQGYIVIGADGKHYKAHRLAWLYHYGEIPKEIDHANLDKSDNRISNLRPATRSQNRSNIRAYKNSASGQKGVSPHGMTGKWQAVISIGGKQNYLGLFERQEDAAAAYSKAAIQLYGSFARVA